MAKPITVLPTTPLGIALEEYRLRQGMTRQDAYVRAGSSDKQWGRLLTETSRFSPKVVKQAAEAVRMPVDEAFAKAGIVVVPDDSRVITRSQLEVLLRAS